jgi:hypothetical protein
MMKEVMRAIDSGFLAEIGLLAFVLAFVLILIRVSQYTRSERQHAKELPVHEPLESYPE